jgi:DNA-binding MarR family transcriptional regulator
VTLEPARSPGFLLWRVTLRWKRQIAEALAPLELTHVQFVLLASLWWLNGEGEQPTQSALAAFAGADVKMASEVLRALEARGLLERETDPRDTRARRLRATAPGGGLAKTAIGIVEAVDSEFFATVDRGVATALLAGLARE